MTKTIWIALGLGVVIAVIIGAIIFKVKNSSTPTATNTTTTAVTAATPTASLTKKITWKVGGVAVTGTYADADTVKLADNNYRMYYSIQPEVKGNNFEVYSATSTDGVTWKPESGVRKTMATFPDVVKLTDGTFRMYFQSAGVLKSASSTDGLTWKDEAGTRIDKTNDLSLTFDNVAAPTVLLQSDGTFLMVYRGTINQQYSGEVTPNKNTQLLLWATSPDGLVWTKKGLAIDSRSTPLYGLADGPELFINDDGVIKLSFWTYTGVYWSTVSGSSFSTPEKVFALAESTPNNKFPAMTAGDPTYAQLNGVWYMYYGQQDGINYAIGTSS